MQLQLKVLVIPKYCLALLYWFELKEQWKWLWQQKLNFLYCEKIFSQSYNLKNFSLWFRSKFSDSAAVYKIFTWRVLYNSYPVLPQLNIATTFWKI